MKRFTFSVPQNILFGEGVLKELPGASYYLIAVSISYAVSGYYGLYKDQTIVYSKYKAKYINRHTRF